MLVATGTAAVAIALSAIPASADQVRSAEWWLSTLGVTSVWPASQGAGVTVAVLSDGVVSSQPDLSGVVATAPAISGAPAAAGRFFGEQGTPIASLIAGRGHGTGGASGIIGVAPEAQILSVPVTVPPDDSQLGLPAVAAAIPAAIAAGIKYAVDHGANVIDLPADPGQPDSAGVGGSQAAAGGSAAEQAAVSYAIAHNVVLVAPAGDDGLTTDAVNYPAAYSGVIAVGAFDSVYDKAPWTSHRSYVTMTAAGAGVMAATNSGGYQPVNSTAAASAVVAGVVALMRSRYPDLSVADIRKALITTTLYQRPSGLSNGSGYGALNAVKAFSAAAVLGTPGKAQAADGALPRATDSPAAAGAGAQSLTSQILRAGEISGAVLVLLLLAVTGYALVGRRRRRPAMLPAAMAAQWTAGHTQSRYPHAPLTDADRMLELFAAPASSPDRPAGRVDAPAPSAEALVGDFWQGDADLFAAPSPAGEAAWPTGSGPASRAVASHTPVSGTPPWEPAQQPEGAVPWNDGSAPQTVRGEIVASGYPLASLPSTDDDLVPHNNGRPAWGDRPDRASSARHAAPDQVSGPPEDGPSRWAEPADPHDVDGGFAEAPASGQHRSGLPIRQPRSAAPASASPTGSLWERSESTPDGGSADTTDAAGRPIFVWDQARSESPR
jgi:hypothetical protein